MGKNTRWIAIIASFFLACAVLQATPPKKKRSHKAPSHRITHHYRRTRHYRRRHYYRHRIRLPKEPSRERTEQIQTALARGGYYQGEPTGRWDANTIAAVQKFQSAHKIDATGKLDAPTLQELGLGSAIAGVACLKRLCQRAAAPPARPFRLPPCRQKSRRTLRTQRPPFRRNLRLQARTNPLPLLQQHPRQPRSRLP